MVYVYVIEGKESGKRYVGITGKLGRRLREHKKKKTKGGQVVGEKFELIHKEILDTHQEARCREKYLKSGKGRELLDSMYPRRRSAEGG